MDQSGKINRMHKSNPNLSVSFEVLKKEIQERDEVIGMLKKKLQVMESFRCSSSSLDALNKYQRSSSIFVIPDEPSVPNEFPSPKMRSMGLMLAMNEDTGGKRTRCHTDTGIWPIAEAPAPSQRLRRPSLFEHFQRLRIPSFLKPKTENAINWHTDEKSQDTTKTLKKSKRGFFKSVLGKFGLFLKKKGKSSGNHSQHSSSSLVDCSASILQGGSNDKTNCSPIELTYEQIISGQFGAVQIRLDKVEEYLNSDDCIEWLGVTKDQLKFLRQDSLEFRKRRVFLCADQLKNYPKETADDLCQ